MKVRVPKELRPPSRFGVFEDPAVSSFDYYKGFFQVRGVFQVPRRGEYYWHPTGQVIREGCGGGTQPRVILDRVEAGKPRGGAR
ncbi:MAG: hypothetical protein A3E01_06570 [Gammaproteobacteria bacterium RIFCSPHIGHO2_12_FULL_63_22]|nr:MAG: hypothetical protein A3E01_06570 [Gammaproteobacteria bacterium RIFCSPHIGHO2_12_FULL_63_22]